MEGSEEPVSRRNMRLFRSLLTNKCLMQRIGANKNISFDALLDSFLVIFDECSKDGMKKDIYISYFVNKYKSLVAEIRSLRVGLGDFQLKSVIGKGYFGEVRVAKEKATGDIFAIKIINKTKTLQNASAALFEEERDILSSATSPWLISLQYAFQDAQNLYLVMEFQPGGDLLSLLEREGGRLSVDNARFYLAEVLLAVHDLHRMGYAHRDLKPDNVLLDRLGHVKLGDFGSAARLSPEGRVLTTMPAGTPDYVAPEVLQALESDKGKKFLYGVECDFWSLGVMAYSLVFGSSPFKGPRTSVTYSKIINHQNCIPYPDSVSVTDCLKDLINNLLKPANDRLDYRAIRKHLFFLEIDFSSIRSSVPPFVPIVSEPDDTSNFICQEKTTVPNDIPSRESQKEFSGKQLPFIGFSYSGELNANPEKEDVGKSSSTDQLRQQQSLETLRRENQELLSKLLSAQKTEKRQDPSVERIERERATLQRDLVKEKQMTTNLRKFIEEERQDRRQIEEKGLMMVKQLKQSQEREMKALRAEYQVKVDDLTDRLTVSYTTNNELRSRCERAELEVAALRLDVEKLQEAETIYKEKLSKARDFRRRSVTDFESRLDRIQNQEEKWQSKFNAEVTARLALLEKLQELRTKSSSDENKWKEDRSVLEENLREAKTKLQALEVQLTTVNVQLADTTKVDVAVQRLSQEQSENSKLRSKINALETELSNTTHTFLETETTGQKEQLKELETELKAATEEKEQLLRKLQALQERDKEYSIKLTDVERILEGLQSEVKKLEEENMSLKKIAGGDSGAPKLTKDELISHQQKVIFLEQQIQKLEGQVERLRETAVLEKQELRSAQSALWRTEKELSDTKIDVRIAKREAKTAEEQVAKLEAELKGVRERLKNMQEKREVESAEESKKIEALQVELKAKEEQVEELKKLRLEAASLSNAHKQLQGEYNSLRQQLLTSDRQLSSTKALLDAQQYIVQTLTNEKTTLTENIESLRGRVSDLEHTKKGLEDTVKILDEQLEDYDKFVTDEAEKIQNLKQENSSLSGSIARLESDLSGLRVQLSEEKTQRSKAETLIENLQLEIAAKSEVVEELRAQLDFANNSSDALSSRLMDKERLVQELEMELHERCQDVNELQQQVLWLKEETSGKLSDIYLFKEENCRLNQELEEASRFADILQERIRELERVITELEAFHRQRELKDDATKQQQNKLICFLQTKIQEDKKKKNQSFAGKLFGSRRREPSSPQTPLVTSPRQSPRSSVKSTSGPLRKKMVTSPRKTTDSPRTRQAISQLVTSPSSRSEKTLPGMHHKIPHSFEVQMALSSGTCHCRSSIPRRTKASVCKHCKIMAHPKCAITAPKTCGLPSGYAKHFAQVINEATEPEKPSENGLDAQGWVDLQMPGESSWRRRYLKVSDGEMLVYDTEPSRADGPTQCYSLVRPGSKTYVSDDVTAVDLPLVAKQDLPFIIKVVTIAETTCWPSESCYLLIRNPADKTKWLTALQNAVIEALRLEDQKSPPINRESENKLIPVFQDVNELNVNCVHDIGNQVMLLGTDMGLYSFNRQSVSSTPVQIHGVTAVHSIAAAPHVDKVLMIAGELRLLVSADYRMLISNANAAACSNPGVQTEVMDLNDADPVMLVAVSEELKRGVFLAAATSSHIHFLLWNNMSSKFGHCASIRTSQAIKCITYHQDSAIIGRETFQRVSLSDFSITDVISNPKMSQTHLRLNILPKKAFVISPNEVLLCYRDIGYFVDNSGQKTRHDLKWAEPPSDFAMCSSYLFVITPGSVEVLKIAPVPDPASSVDDLASIATTATISGTNNVVVSEPRLLGIFEKCGIFVGSNTDILIIEGNQMGKGDLGSRDALNRVNSEGQFSFTSSIVGSLDGDSDNSSPEKVQHTEL